eukprot:56182-Amphidinium_carterae.1
MMVNKTVLNAFYLLFFATLLDETSPPATQPSAQPYSPAIAAANSAGIQGVPAPAPAAPPHLEGMRELLAENRVRILKTSLSRHVTKSSKSMMLCTGFNSSADSSHRQPAGGSGQSYPTRPAGEDGEEGDFTLTLQNTMDEEIVRDACLAGWRRIRVGCFRQDVARAGRDADK